MRKLNDWQEPLKKRVTELEVASDENKKVDEVTVWLTRDMRHRDNWALIHAINLAKQNSAIVKAVFTIAPQFLGATWRQFSFMIDGLEELEANLDKLGINMEVLCGEPVDKMSEYLEKQSKDGKKVHLVTDFSPVRPLRLWKEKVQSVVKKCGFGMSLVDAHNIVPVWVTSDKAEFAARTIRPKIGKLLPEFLTDFPQIEDLCKDLSKSSDQKNVDWENVRKFVKENVDMNVLPSDHFKGGESHAEKTLKVFLEEKIGQYDELRNDPNKDMQSNLSPYLHFGQISAQRVVLESMKFYNKSVWSELSQTFYDEIIVRRELSDNFCYYNKDSYDSMDGAPSWARESLQAHEKDKRQYVYTKEQFEKAKTHDEIWNSAQMELINTGKMHGYMRMYWAKKILEWTEKPSTAIEIAIFLNDKYELDGRDPNGYVGVLWSIAGLHDRAWFPRPIFGTVRYMAESGLRKKFNVDLYVKKWLGTSKLI